MAHAQVAPLSRTTGARPAFPAPPVQPAALPSFTAVLRQRHCTRLLIASVAGRLPLGMLPVALILAARSDGHSLATASVLAALYGVAPAIGLPLLGRLADIRGLPLPCHLGAALVTAALAALALGGTSHLLFAALCAVLAGAGCPPLEGGLRSLWPAVLPDAAHVRTAYALDSSTQEIVYVAGPALAVAVATWLSPAWALALAAAVALAGSVVFATARPARSWRTVARRRDPLGVLRPPALRLLLFALVFLGGTVGALDVASIAVAGRQDAAWLAGALPAVFSAAGLLGGILFARLQPATAPPVAASAAGGRPVRGRVAPSAGPAPGLGRACRGGAAGCLVRSSADRGQPHPDRAGSGRHLHRGGGLDVQRDAAGPGRRHRPGRAARRPLRTPAARRRRVRVPPHGTHPLRGRTGRRLSFGCTAQAVVPPRGTASLIAMPGPGTAGPGPRSGPPRGWRLPVLPPSKGRLPCRSRPSYVAPNPRTAPGPWRWPPPWPPPRSSD